MSVTLVPRRLRETCRYRRLTKRRSMFTLGFITGVWAGLIVPVAPAFAAAAFSVSAATSAPAVDSAAALRAMEDAGDRYDPASIVAGGAASLTGLLNCMSPSLDGTEPTYAQIVSRLESDDWVVRDAEGDRLVRSPGVQRAPVERAAVERATQSESPEVRLRARTVLAAWAIEQSRTSGRLPAGMRAYASRLDDEMAAPVITAHLSRSLAQGLPLPRYWQAVSQLLAVVTRSRDEQLLKPFVPLLKHADAEVAVFVTRALGQPVHGNGYYPPFLLSALASDREEVVRAAAKSGPAPIWDEERGEAIRDAMKRAFARGSDATKFDLSFTLMQSFRDPDAFRYLLGHVASDDRHRAHSAISWVGDSCHWQNPAPPELIHALKPLLRAEDEMLRRAAACSLATWAGKEIVELLIPMLIDPAEIIRTEVARKLVEQRDRAMLRTALSGAAASDPNPDIRAAARRLLDGSTAR